MRGADFPHAQTRGEAPSPGAQERADLSPQAGRGEAARQQLNLALMGAALVAARWTAARGSAGGHKARPYAMHILFNFDEAGD